MNSDRFSRKSNDYGDEYESDEAEEDRTMAGVQKIDGGHLNSSGHSTTSEEVIIIEEDEEEDDSQDIYS
jgi:hypothetical protein